LAAVAAGAALVLAACGSSKSTTAPATTVAPAASATTAGSGGAAVTISAASVPGVGTVLVNSAGHTLYLLTSEKGGKITCTAASGCSAYWPAVELPAGTTTTTAGGGVQASLLGTVKGTDGSEHVTYAGYPLYTFAGDSAAGADKGQGVQSFGGTWWAISPSGMAVTTTGSSPTTPTTSSGGYGY
jgi:predicted lipoprotein with Yx(FWY)xxD motif